MPSYLQFVIWLYAVYSCVFRVGDKLLNCSSLQKVTDVKLWSYPGNRVSVYIHYSWWKHSTCVEPHKSAQRTSFPRKHLQNWVYNNPIILYYNNILFFCQCYFAGRFLFICLCWYISCFPGSLLPPVDLWNLYHIRPVLGHFSSPRRVQQRLLSLHAF